MAAPAQVAKVRVSKDGKVYFNQRAVSFDELSGEFQRLRDNHGAVSLVDESSAGESWRQGQKVKKAIIDAQLLMKLD